MKEFTITITDVEEAALAHVMASPEQWTQNAIRNRARLAIEEIVEREMARMLADPETVSIPASIEDIVFAAEIQTVKPPNIPNTDSGNL